MQNKTPRLIVGQGDGCPRVVGRSTNLPSSQSSKLPHIRIQLKESKKIQKSIRDVLVPRGHFKFNIDEYRKSCRLPDIVDRNKERLRIRFGIEVRKDEMERRKEEIEVEQENIEKWEKNVQKQHFDFELMCKDKNDSAAKALMEAENWTRKRLRLSRPVVMLQRHITFLRSEINTKENRFEKLTEYKHFIILIFHNFTNLIHRPITIEQFLVLPDHHLIINSISLQSIDSESFAIKEQRLLNEDRAISQSTLEVRESRTCPAIPHRLEEFSPDDIEYELEEMESRNLRLIENWQASADEVIDLMVSHSATLSKLDKSLKDVKSQINMACAEIVRCTERSEELKLYCSMFSEGIENGLFNGDDILNEYKRKVRRLYNHVTEVSTMNIEIETLVMLTAVETRLMDLIMDEEQLDATKVQAAQRDIERRRKAELYEQKNKEAENSRVARNQRALERNNQTQKIKKGRRLMKRSMNMQPKELSVKSTEQFKDSMGLSEEDSSYYFM